MTLDEAIAAGRPAHVDAGGIHGTYLPGQGAYLDYPGDLDQLLRAPGLYLPRDGWLHDQPCDCEFCRLS